MTDVKNETQNMTTEFPTPWETDGTCVRSFDGAYVLAGVGTFAVGMPHDMQKRVLTRIVNAMNRESAHD